jgi:hypothetical protein
MRLAVGVSGGGSRIILKRPTMIDMAAGDADHYLRELGRAGGLS